MSCVSAEDTNSTDSDTMGSDFTGNFQDLQDLIDDAEEYEIELNDDYNGSGMVSIKKNLIINGNGHYIDANSKSAILYIGDCTVVLNNIKFYNANEEFYSGGAIFSDGILGVSGCEFYNNYAHSGGGAIASYNELYVEDSVFVNNLAGYGGGIFAKNVLDVRNSMFMNSAGGVEFIDYYDGDDETSGTINLANNTMESPYLWDIWCEGDTPIESLVYLYFTDSTYESAENVEIAYLIDSNLNTYKVDSINVKIYDNATNVLVDSATIAPNDKGYVYNNANLKPGVYRTTGSVSSAYAKYCPVIGGTLTINGETPESETISAPAVEKYYKGPERFVVTLKDSDGKPIVGGTVKISINGNTYEKTTNNAGSASLGINLDSGDYDVDVEYNGEKIKSSVKVISTMEGNDLTKMFKNSSQYSIKVVDTNGNPLAGKKVTFNINGVFYGKEIDKNGIARLNINLIPGTYVITATNPENGEQHSNTITILPTIVKNQDMTKYYKNGTQYTVRLLDAQGNPVGAGESVSFNINGVFYTKKTDKNGYATMNINLRPGKYIITAEYNGFKVSNNIRVLGVLSGKDITMEHYEEKQYEVKLVDGQGKPYSGQTVSLNINGVVYNRITDGDGVARLNIKLRPGTYIITASYNGYGISNTIQINPKILSYDCGYGHKIYIPSSASVEKESYDWGYLYWIEYEDGYGEVDIESTSDSVSDAISYFTYYGAKYTGYYNKWAVVDNRPLVRQGEDISCYSMWYKDGYLYSVWADDLNIARRISESFR